LQPLKINFTGLFGGGFFRLEDYRRVANRYADESWLTDPVANAGKAIWIPT